METTAKNATNAYRLNLKEKILKTANTFFHSQGIKSVKMDDIAHHLAISKRTLYELFGNKEELLLACIKRGQEELSLHIQEMVNEGANIMEIFIELIAKKIETVNHIHPRYFTEINKYPSVMAYLDKKREENQANSESFFRKGVEEGYFLPDINFNIVVEISNNCVEHVMSSEMYNHYPLHEINRTITIVFVRGLCTEKGVKCIDQMLAEL